MYHACVIADSSYLGIFIYCVHLHLLPLFPSTESIYIYYIYLHLLHLSLSTTSILIYYIYHHLLYSVAFQPGGTLKSQQQPHTLISNQSIQPIQEPPSEYSTLNHPTTHSSLSFPPQSTQVLPQQSRT